MNCTPTKLCLFLFAIISNLIIVLSPVRVNATDTSYIQLNIGQSHSFDCSSCDDAAFVSSNPKIADFDKQYHFLNTFASGYANITTVCPEHGRKYYRVLVISPQLELNVHSATIYSNCQAGSTIQLKTTSKIGADHIVNWTSSDVNVATVSPSGKVTAVAPGNAVITANYNNLITTSTINVIEANILFPIQNITLNTKSNGNRYKLTPNVIGPKKQIKWETSDKKIATVSNGTITAKSPGTAVILATANGITRNITVTVKDTLSIDHKYLKLYVGQTKLPTLKAALNGKLINGEWHSTNNNIVEVNSGKLTPISPGVATITCTDGNTTDSCIVEVKNTDITLDKSALQLNSVGTYSTDTLSATVSGYNNKIKWSTSDKSIVTVNSNGKVQAKKEGTATIYATANDKTASCEISVINASLSNIPTKLLIEDTGNTYTLTPTYSGIYNSITYFSSNSAIATVSHDGIIKTFAPGSAKITIVSNGLSKTCNVKVNQITTTLSKDVIGLNTHSYPNETLKAKVTGPNRQILWTSSNTDVATVNNNGTVTAIAKGSAIITATANNKSSSCTVCVSDKDNIKGPITLTIDKKSILLNERGTNTSAIINATVSGTTEPLIWFSSNPNVVSVNQSGRVQAERKGSATITASIGNKRCTCRISVIDNQLSFKQPLVDMDINSPKKSLYKLKPTIKGTSKDITYISTNENVAIIEKGTVKAVEEGATTIIAKANGLVATCDVNVVNSNHQHEYIEDIIQEPTCTVNGLKSYTCKSCLYIRHEIITPLGHSFSDEYTVDESASCTKYGLKSKYCLRDGCKQNTDTIQISKLEHSYNDIIQNNNEVANGYKFQACTECNDIINEQFLIEITSSNVQVPESSYYPKGSNVTLKALVDSNYNFDGWFINDEKVSSDLEYTICNIDKALQIYATATPRSIFATANDISIDYDGLEHYIDVFVTPSDATIYYSIDDENYSTNNISLIDAGTYTIYYQAEKTGYIPAKGSVTVTINQIKGTGQVSMSDWTYGSNPSIPCGISTTNNNTEISYYYKQEDDSDDNYSPTIPTNAGSYIVKAFFPGNQNYTECFAFSPFTIHPYDLSYAQIDSIIPQAYTGIEVSPIPTITANDTSLTYNTDFICDEYSNNIDIGTGSCLVIGTGNYTGSRTVTFSIENISTTLLSGSDINKRLKEASGHTKASTDTVDTNITAIHFIVSTEVHDGAAIDTSNRTTLVFNESSGEVTVFCNANILIAPRSLDYAFAGLHNVETITGLDLWNTKETFSTANMFNSTGSKASSFYLDISNFNTYRMNNMYNMFANTGINASEDNFKIIIPNRTPYQENTREKLYGQHYDQPYGDVSTNYPGYNKSLYGHYFTLKRYQ